LVPRGCLPVIGGVGPEHYVADKKGDSMKRFVSAVRSSVENQNWYSALFVALSLPDICGKLENPAKFSGDRYKDWFEKYMAHHYAHKIGPDHTLHVFLSPRDCYALRCAFLHEGEDELNNQKSREVLERIHFVAPTPGMMVHCNQYNNILQVQVDIFCNQICDGVEQWFRDIAGNAGIQARMSSLAKIYTVRDQVI
jgi:hypothetical protein